ncbi:MAG: methyltransferase domain-containing protein [Geminicoccaceae bacterium]
MSAPRLFDRGLLAQRRARARRGEPVRFLHDEIADRLAERVAEIRRDLASVLVLGPEAEVLADRLSADRSSTVVTLEPDTGLGTEAALRVVGDDEVLPFADERFDAVVGGFGLHWVNDLPGVLIQLRRSLRPDGLLLLAFPGGNTLHELRECLLDAELAVRGGAAARISPFVDVRDGGALLQRAGFALPVADVERITVTYADPLRLLADLRGMGQTNALVDRPRLGLSRQLVATACRTYVERFGTADGRVTATFEFLFLTGWKPAASQPKPLRPGSGTVDLRDVLGRGGSDEESGG